MGEKGLAVLLGGFREEGAAAEAQKLGMAALPVFRRAFKKLDSHDSIKAQWYASLLLVLDADIFTDICQLADEIPYGLSNELAWILRHPRYDAKGKAALGELESLIQPKLNEADFYLGDYYFPAILVEALGRGQELEAAPFLEKILERHLATSDPRKKDCFSLSGEHCFTASLATVLLLFRELGQSSRYSPQILVKLAAAAFIAAKRNSINGPLPLLFLPMKDGGRLILEEITNKLDPVDPFLSDLFYYFKTTQEMGLSDIFLKAGLKPLSWLERLEKACDRTSYGPGCALALRKALDPDSANHEALARLAQTRMSDDEMRLTLQGLDIKTCDPAALPFICEIKFHFSDPSARKDWTGMNARLTELGQPPVADWNWLPDFSALGKADAGPLAALVKLYAAVLADPTAPITAKPPALIILLKIRLLCTRSSQGTAALQALGGLIHSLSDAAVLGAAYSQSLRIIGKKEGLALLWLSHPRIDENTEFVEDLVDTACRFKSQEARDSIVEFAFRLGWSPAKGDYGVWNKLTLYFARVGEERAIPVLVPLKGASTLGSAFEIAIVNLGEAHPGKVDDVSFMSALRGLLEDGFTDYQLVSFGSRSIVSLCALAASKDESSIRVSAYGVSRLIDSRKSGPRLPVELLLCYLKVIDEAVARAKSDPGEAWEDRNWGGYNMSGAEEYASELSEAIRRLLKQGYTKAECEALRAALPPNQLSHLCLVESTSFSIDYPSLNLGAVLGF